MNILQEAASVLKTESAAIEATIGCLDSRFEQVMARINTVYQERKKLIFSGIGKNVFVAQKIAATFNSTGVPTLFLDPVAAMHGDLGLCRDGDLALLMSNSGESEELVALVPVLKRLGVTTVAITKEKTSRLATACDLALMYSVPTEACPLNLAPTASTTAALALGDALAMVFLKMRGFRAEDFAKYHPSGTLGRTLLLTVADVMRPRVNMPVVSREATVMQALNAMTEKKAGLVTVVDEADKLVGVFSDGDFRRLALKNKNPLEEKVEAHMVRTPRVIQSNLMAVEVLKRYEKNKINQIPVVDEHGFPVGLVDIQDLPAMKIV